MTHIVLDVDGSTRARYEAAARRLQMGLTDWIYDTLGYASDPESGSDVLAQSPLRDRPGSPSGASEGAVER